MDTLDTYRGEIYFHYIVGKKKLKKVMEILKTNHNARFSVKQYRTKLGEWGYYKNTRKSEVISVLRHQGQRKRVGKESAFYSHQRPVRMQDIERYQKRYKRQLLEELNREGSGKGPRDQIVCRTPPPNLMSLQMPGSVPVSERFLYCLDGLIRGSFESKAWEFFDNDRLIESSPQADVEQRMMMRFLFDIDQGCNAARTGDFTSAGDQWKDAFIGVESLVTGKYHDIVPNIISKARDLHDWGFPDLATKLMTHIANLCRQTGRPDHPLSSVLIHLDGISPDRVGHLEDQVWKMFLDIFTLYVGPQCYNTFVMMMDQAKRKLWSSEKDDIDESLPLLSQLDKEFGPLNCRSLDVLRLRIEVSYHRRQYQRVLQEAPILIARANAKVDDPWQRHYFLIKALYHAGSAHFFLGNNESAKQSFEYAKYLDGEFSNIDSSDQFRSERESMQEKLDILRVVELF